MFSNVLVAYKRSNKYIVGSPTKSIELDLETALLVAKSNEYYNPYFRKTLRDAMLKNGDLTQEQIPQEPEEE